jgi:hypothetical protein
VRLSPARNLDRSICRPDYGQLLAANLEEVECLNGGIGSAFVTDVNVRVAFLTAAPAVARKRYVRLSRTELTEELQEVVFGRLARISGDE